ncbi:phosphoribosylpyrophosphate synthetase [Flavobacterium sp. K77]|uniref:phosphoribosylpyrophosphate synthetase n=1 Tax=Flavobacterium sp. K77 TaxID=2910676 RepID=UPI001F39FAC0|nr:phosphoribosylpyrophosphate synthetase [Flavobacterium sp. K77]MCF6141167.1 phosphoribosylpyrophosphate synthetase [Flavobacterium sp. K77]
MEKINMDSLITVLADIEKLGFRSQFEVTGNNLVSLKTNTHFLPEEVTIKHFYRFEGESNPDDSSILYAIEGITGEKGTLVDGYGISADADTANFMLQVSTSKAKNI